jgi:hypothetical protein
MGRDATAVGRWGSMHTHRYPTKLESETVVRQWTKRSRGECCENSACLWTRARRRVSFTLLTQDGLPPLQHC